MSEKSEPQSPEDVTSLLKREFAIQAFWLLQGAINHLREAELHDEARRIETIAPSVAKAAGWDWPNL